MKPNILLASGAALLGVAMLLATPLAQAHDRVNWSISVGSSVPGIVYAPPPAVYVQPQPVYVAPQPVYVQPAPTVVYSYPGYVTYGQAYYGSRPYHHHHHGGYQNYAPRRDWR